MAEIIVRIRAHPSTGDFYRDCRALGPGDVIEVMPDGHGWGVLDQQNPDWRIIKFPGVPVRDLLAFLAPEVGTDPAQPSKTLQPRAFKFDLTNPGLPTELKAVIADDARTLPKVEPVTKMASTDVLAFKVAKPAITDPAVIGVDPKVIG